VGKRARREECEGLGSQYVARYQKKLNETNGVLVLEDESGLSLIPLMGRTWAPRGCTPTIRHNSSWDKLSAIAGITLDGKIHFKAYDKSIKSEQIIEYLEQLMRYIPLHHIVLLWDGSRTHTSNATKTFLAEHSDRMTAFRLPPYSPRFNPVELLWAEIKWSRLRGYCPKSNWELKRKLYSRVSALRRKASLVRSYFDASDLPIGPTEKTKLCRYQ
jgi:transposase